jgi:hypothetical protein
LPLPTPRLGLVVHYGFVWARSGGGASPDAGKDRPCLIVRVRVLADEALPGSRVLRVAHQPISHVAPRGGEQAIEIPVRVAERLGLSVVRSYLYVSYAVEDDWPFDLAHIPGSADRFDYGFVPPALFEAFRDAFIARAAKLPGSIYRR